MKKNINKSCDTAPLTLSTAAPRPRPAAPKACRNSRKYLELTHPTVEVPDSFQLQYVCHTLDCPGLSELRRKKSVKAIIF